VGGDSGFLTPCNNREVAIADVNGDTWPDVITCVSLSDASPSTSATRASTSTSASMAAQLARSEVRRGAHPAAPGAGSGLRWPAFLRMGAVDVTGDGAPDLYFVDYDAPETGIGEAAGADLNDACSSTTQRLLLGPEARRVSPRRSSTPRSRGRRE